MLGCACIMARSAAVTWSRGHLSSYWSSRQFKSRSQVGSATQTRCVMFRLFQYFISKVSTTLLLVNDNICTTYTLAVCIKCV